MDEIIQLFTMFTPVQAITFILLIIISLKFIIETIIYFKNIIMNWYNKKNNIETKEGKIENRIKTLEEHDNWKYDKILDLEAGQTNITQKLDDLREKNRLEVIAQYRSTIYRLHKEFTSKGYMTESEYEMFRNLADIYLDYGGNGYYRNHVIPEIEALPIRE